LTSSTAVKGIVDGGILILRSDIYSWAIDRSLTAVFDMGNSSSSGKAADGVEKQDF
jgi:hypothetical protein